MQLKKTDLKKLILQEMGKWERLKADLAADMASIKDIGSGKSGVEKENLRIFSSFKSLIKSHIKKLNHLRDEAAKDLHLMGIHPGDQASVIRLFNELADKLGKPFELDRTGGPTRPKELPPKSGEGE